MKTLILIGLLVLTLSAGHEGNSEDMKEHQHHMMRNHKVHHLNIKAGSRFVIKTAQNYEMQSQDDCVYSVAGLPKGVELMDNKIKVSENAPAGNHVVRIRCTMPSGKVSEKLATISVIHHQVKEQKHEEQKEAKGDQAEHKNNPQSQKLRSVIKNYSTVTKTTKTQYSNNRYPEVNFPSGANQNSINTVPMQIQNADAAASQSNRNKVTAQDVALRAASERHQNSIKAITNLLTIIDQARANRDYAEKHLEKYIMAYNDALKHQRKTQNEIIAFETRKSQIASAIEGVNSKIEHLKTKIAELEADQAQYNDKKAKLLEIIAGEERMKAELLGSLENVSGDLASRVRELAEARERCQAIKANIAGIQRKLNSAESELENVIQRRMDAQAQVRSREDDVQRLRRQLQAAENALADANINLADITELQNKIPEEIAEIKSRLASAQGELAACEDNVARLQGLIGSLDSNTGELVKEIEELEDSILEDRKVAMEIDDALASLVEPLENARVQLKGAEEDILFLRAQMLRVEEDLRQAYIRGNEANTHVSHARQNLDAINSRYKEEEKRISEATLNLQRARAEQALARLSVEQLIAHYTNALPYSIVPNGNGETDAGKPAGNNPSGSPLGPIKTDRKGAPGEHVIKDWTHYLSMAYGAGVDPNFAGSVTKLYPFSFSSKVEGNKVTNPGSKQSYGGNCGGNGPMRVASGVVTAIYDNAFRVKANGEEFVIEVSDCTRMSSNKKNYRMRRGDKAIVKGAQKNKHKIHASQMTCLR